MQWFGSANAQSPSPRRTISGSTTDDTDFTDEPDGDNLSPCDQHGMIDVFRGVLERCSDVFRLEERKVPQDLLLGRSAREHVQHILDANAVVTNAGASAALFRIEGDALGVFHGRQVNGWPWLLQERLCAMIPSEVIQVSGCFSIPCSQWLLEALASPSANSSIIFRM